MRAAMSAFVACAMALDIIAMVATKGTLTDAQREAIRGTRAERDSDVVDGEFTPTGEAA